MSAPYNPQVFRPASDPLPDRRTLMIEELEQNLQHLSPRDQEFAKSLIGNFRNYGLSQKQGNYVAILLDRVDEALGRKQEVQLPAKFDKSGEQLAPGFTKIVALFLKAKEQGLKWPKIRLQTSQGEKIVLRLSQRGDVTVTDNATSFDDRRYYGRISPQGFYAPTEIVTPDVTQLLKDLAQNPAEMAALYGHQTSNCCFCGLQLTTSESVTVGYGPICADNFGLPWGIKVRSTYTKLTVEDRV